MSKEMEKDLIKIFKTGFFIFIGTVLLFFLTAASRAITSPQIFLIPLELSMNDGMYSVSLKLSNAVNAVKFSSEIQYDEGSLKYDHLMPKGAFSQKQCIYTITPGSGSLKISVNCDQAQMVDGDTDIADIYFQARKNGAASLTAVSSTLVGFWGRVYSAQDGNISLALSTPDSKAPEISDNGSSQGTLPSTATEATLSIATDENAICKFSQSAGTLFDNIENNLSGENLLHEAKISGLENNRQYKFYVKCRDSAQNVSQDFVISFYVGQASPFLSVNSQPASINKTANTSLKISYGNLKDIADISFDVLFDDSILEYDRFEPENYLGISCNFRSGLKKVGDINIHMACAAHPVSGSGEIGQLFFKGKAKGTSVVQLSSALLFDNSFVPKEVIAVLNNDAVKVVEAESKAPQISNGMPRENLAANTQEATLSVETDEDAVCKYSSQPGKAYQEMESNFNETGGKNHSSPLTGLSNNRSYSYYVKCQDDLGNTSPDYIVSFSVDDFFPTVSIVPQTATLNKNEIYAAKMNIFYADSFKSLVANISYDGRIMDYDHFSKKESLSECNLSVTNKSSGILKFTVECNSSLVDGREFGTIFFKAKAAGKTNVAFTDGHLFDSAFLANEIQALWKGAEVNVIETDVLPPDILTSHDQGMYAPGTTQVLVKLETNEDAFCRLSDRENVSFPSMDYEFDQTGSRTHLVLISGLDSGYNYILFAKCRDFNGNVTSDFKLYFGVADHENGGGGGGSSSSGSGGGASGGTGGGAAAFLPGYDEPEIGDNKKESSDAYETEKGTSTAKDIKVVKSKLEQSSEKIYDSEAKMILNCTKRVELTSTEQTIYTRLMKKLKNIAENVKYQVASFIKTGTQTTRRLGAGERAGVVNSYQAAFGNIPSSEKEWSDALRIANGRWPVNRNKAKETKAKDVFKKIYLRESNMKNNHDDAAIMLITYGLRPAKRNLKAEIPAISYFTSIFKHSPAIPEDWDTVRAISYSGAKR